MNQSVILTLILGIHTCQAGNFVVENLNDDGAGSLRAAIVSANENSDASSISFSTDLQSGGPHTIALSSPLVITAPIEIIGPGREVLFISGQDSVSAFVLSGSTEDNPHRLNSFTVQNGRATLGGANIRVSGYLELRNCSILNGQTTATGGNDADGGGLFHSEGNLLIDACLFQGNSTIGNVSQGGGVYTESGTATISNSRIIGNTTDGSVSEGGGIASRSIMTLENCEIAENRTLNVFSGGGGIYSDTDTVIRQCTIVNNSVGTVTGTGGYSIGGAFANVASGDATFESCTITGNFAPPGMGQGAGISSISSGTLSFRNCIVAGNGTSDLDRASQQTTYSDDGFNLFGVVANTNLNDTGNRAGTSTYEISDPQLSALDFHGGITRTQIPLPDSPALNDGPLTADSNYDQRGTDFPRLVGASLDIGACERQDFTDSDQDGIPDAIEVLIPEFATSDGDLDDDGVSDSVEFRLLGSSAVLNPNLKPSLQLQPISDGFLFQFPTTPNREYRVVYNTDLVSPLTAIEEEFQRFTLDSQVTLEIPFEGARAFFFLEGRIPLEPIE